MLGLHALLNLLSFLLNSHDPTLGGQRARALTLTINDPSPDQVMSREERGGGDVSVTSGELMLLKMNNCFGVVSIVTLKSDFRSRALHWRVGEGVKKSVY